MKKFGFVYIWFDSKRKKYYIGSHLGSKEDGYVGSNKRLFCAYKSRPHTFKRRILKEGFYDCQKDLLRDEQNWLNLIKDEELHGAKYYNEKKVAAGGDIVSTLPEEKRSAHKHNSLVPRKKGHDKWMKNNPDRLIEIVSNAGKKSAVVNKGKNLKQEETLKKRTEQMAFMTPIGPRPFLTKAAKELGISYQTLRKKIDNSEDGYHWINPSNHFYKSKNNG